MKTKLCILLIGLLSISMVGTAHAVTFKWVERSSLPFSVDGSITFDDAQWLAGDTVFENSITDFKWSVDNGNGFFDFADLIPTAVKYSAKFNTEPMTNDGMGFQLNIKINEKYQMYLNDLTWKTVDNLNGWGEANGFGHWEMTVPPAAVPEPASMFLLGSGLLGLALFRKQKKA